jgi:hypothetical protein
MTAAALDGANLDITYSVPSTITNSAYPLTVEFFLADSSGQEGQVFLAQDTFTTTHFNSGVDRSISIPAGNTTTGSKIVASVIDQSGNSSEFSVGRIVGPLPESEIAVLDGVTNVDDGATIDFGATTVGNSVDKVLTVNNTGDDNLTLTPIDTGSLPAGFSLVSNFGRTTLAMGESTTFTIHLDAGSEGTPSGSFSFANNDADENPFDLVLQGTVNATLGFVDKIDFGTTSSPVAADFMQATSLTSYTAQARFGWQNGSLINNELDRGTGSDLVRDIVVINDATFLVDLPNGPYDVIVHAGDMNKARDQLAISLEGTLVDTVSTSSGQVVSNTYLTTVTDGQLTLHLEDLGGSTNNSSIAGLEIVPLVTTAMPGAVITLPINDPGTSNPAVAIRFSNAAGFSVDVPIVDAIDGSVAVGVPPIVDQTTGAFVSGTVTIEILLDGVPQTPPVINGFQIQELPAPVVPPGEVTIHFLNLLLDLTQQIQQGISGTFADISEVNAALAEDVTDFQNLVPSVQAIIDDPAHSIAPVSLNGNPVSIGSAELANVDRMLAGLLHVHANLGAGNDGTVEAGAFLNALLTDTSEVINSRDAYLNALAGGTIEGLVNVTDLFTGTTLAHSALFLSSGPEPRSVQSASISIRSAVADAPSGAALLVEKTIAEMMQKASHRAALNGVAETPAATAAANSTTIGYQVLGKENAGRGKKIIQITQPGKVFKTLTKAAPIWAAASILVGVVTSEPIELSIDEPDPVNESEGPLFFTVSSDKEVTLPVLIVTSASMDDDPPAGAMSASPNVDFEEFGGVGVIFAGQDSTTFQLFGSDVVKVGPTFAIIDDQDPEPTETFRVTLTGGVATSGNVVTVDPLNSFARGTILDDEPGIRVSPTSGLNTSEALFGGPQVVDFELKTEPVDEGGGLPYVDLPISVTLNGNEGRIEDPNTGQLVASTTLRFSLTQLSHSIVIRGQDDNVVDGDVAYMLITGDPTSNDPTYENLSANDVDDVRLVNLDDDVRGVTIEPTSLSVTEGDPGDPVVDTATYTIKLDTQPTGNVTIDFSGDSQVDVSPSQVIFSPTGPTTPPTYLWNSPVTITVSAKKDTDVEGTHSGMVAHTISGEDEEYNEISIPDLPVSITDNDSHPDTPFVQIDSSSCSGVPWTNMVVTASGRVGAPLELDPNGDGLWDMAFDVFDWLFQNPAVVTADWNVTSSGNSFFRMRRDPGNPEVAFWSFTGTGGLIGDGSQVNMRARLGGPNSPWIDSWASEICTSSLHASHIATVPTSGSELNSTQLDQIVGAATAIWKSSGFVSNGFQSLNDLRFEILDLPDTTIGLTGSDVIYLDSGAAGHGWFIDSTPWVDEEFEYYGGQLMARDDSDAAGSIDLLTVVLHEMGHILGLDDLYDDEHLNDLMFWEIEQGMRKLPAHHHADSAFASLGNEM